MPISTRWEHEGYVYECRGIVTSQDILESRDDFLQVPEGVTPKFQLIDCLKVDRFDLTEMDIVNISADDLAASRKYPNIKVAMIAQKGHVIEVFMAYLKVSWAINTSWEIRVFSSMEAAHDWLDYIKE